jgi:hypothetical protein
VRQALKGLKEPLAPKGHRVRQARQASLALKVRLGLKGRPARLARLEPPGLKVLKARQVRKGPTVQ